MQEKYDYPSVTFYGILRGFFTGQDPKQFLFFTRTPGGIEAGKAVLERLKERSQNRDTDISVGALFAQLEALRTWGLKAPADLSVVKHPVLVANGDADQTGNAGCPRQPPFSKLKRTS